MPQLLVLGSAPCLEDDLALLDVSAFDAAAVNRAGCRYAGRIGWWVTYHPSIMLDEGWAQQRARIGGNDDYTLVLHEPHVDAQRQAMRGVIFPGPAVTGSSTLLAVTFGLAHGYEHIVVAGAPLQGNYTNFQAGWKRARKQLAGRVSSMSGWTKTFLESL